jgi:hypothetical protein
MSRRVLELKLKERDLKDSPEQDDLARYRKTPGTKERAGKK